MQAQMLRERGHQRVWGVRYEREGGRGQPSHAPVAEPPLPAQWPPAAAASDRLPPGGDAGHISYTASAFTPPPQQHQHQQHQQHQQQHQQHQQHQLTQIGEGAADALGALLAASDKQA